MADIKEYRLYVMVAGLGLKIGSFGLVNLRAVNKMYPSEAYTAFKSAIVKDIEEWSGAGNKSMPHITPLVKLCDGVHSCTGYSYETMGHQKQVYVIASSDAFKAAGFHEYIEENMGELIRINDQQM